MSDVFILKYRPQKIADLDLTEVREGLLKIVKSGKIPHALLFVGPRGTGKTSAARIMAKVVNCLNQKKTLKEPCNRCQACKEITAGTALDLVEIDAASTRGIDDIRNLKEKVRLAPTQLKTKVYIIDEVHMLTTEAFNALLKTLEEPPANTIFILCTTAPEKLPATIVSRCTKFNFRKAKKEEVIDSLKRVARGEKLKAEKETLEEIAKSADGSFRDAHKILDQLTSGQKKITLKETKELLGRVEALSPQKLLAFLAAKEVKKALLEIERIVSRGGDLAVYCQEILKKLRFGLLAKVGLAGISPPQETAKLTQNQLRFLITLFSRAAVQIKTSPIPQLPLELAVVEWCASEEDAPGKKTSNPGYQAKKTSPANSGRLVSSSKTASAGRMTLKEVENRWPELLKCIKPLNHSVEALLRASRPVNISGDTLTLEVFYRFHKERLEEDKCRTIFEEAASQVFGLPVRLKCLLGEKRIPSAAAQKAVPPAVPAENFDQDVTNDIIKAAEEIFGNNLN